MMEFAELCTYALCIFLHFRIFRKRIKIRSLENNRESLKALVRIVDILLLFLNVSKLIDIVTLFMSIGIANQSNIIVYCSLYYYLL